MSSLDKTIIKSQKITIDELKAQIDALKSQSVQSSLVSLHDVLNDAPDEPDFDVDDFLSDNTTFNFRLNAVLKKEFTEVCKRQHLTVASALKRYMTDCVRSRRLN